MNVRFGSEADISTSALTGSKFPHVEFKTGRYLLVLLLAGCSADASFWRTSSGAPLPIWSTATPEQRATQDAKEQQELRDQAQRTAQAIVNEYGPICDRSEFQRNTDQWRDCVLNLYDADNRVAQPGPAGPIVIGDPSRQQCVMQGNLMICRPGGPTVVPDRQK